jgi:hypothetical protein
MDWSYVAGFTDGDGCISRELAKGTYSYARLRWSQKLDSADVLYAIADFLGEQGLKVSERNYSVSVKGHKYPQCELAITNAEDTRVALHAMLPYLVLKKQRALEAIEILDQAHAAKCKYGWKYRAKLLAETSLATN